MQSNKFCPRCGKQNTIILSDTLGMLFTLDNKPDIPRGDALHTDMQFDVGPELLLSPGICDSSFALTI